ncbi:alanine racemase [Clostridium sp. TF11-13AC]|uniref:alanine racemase n=1 Tax=Clostridium sp. TF11-13AC TaxID=2293053 RepID=UPI000E554D22|nr:alanine racemase [Clostridium sp. TF11-13AC]RHU44984.1 pyridoxal-dependent decarboxylase [Clostridium sp. TF11-13AC]
MIIDKKMISTLRANYGDAFYILDSRQFQNNFLELKSEFASIYPNFNIAYSYKTNYIPKLCKIVNELGGYAETVSEMEVELALKCGVTPDRIIWNGPIKERTKLAEFLLQGVTVNIDSLEEAEDIRRIAKETEKKLNVGIRCNYDVGDGVCSRFGFDINSRDFNQVLDMLTHTNNLHFMNFQCHFAKRQLEYWPARAKGMIQLLDKVGIIPDRIDIGGGIFGKMPEELKQQIATKIPNYKEYAIAVATIFQEYFKDKDKLPELLVEPGTAIVGDCMKFVGTVKTIKDVRGKKIASILGSQKNISMSGVNPPIEIVHMGETEKKYEKLDMVGYTCIEGDVIYKDYSGKLALGDAVIISNCGSYSLVMKPPFILPNFPVLDICGNEVEVIKRKETFEDIFHTFKF